MSWLPRKEILVPIDFSDASFHALETAREMLAPGGKLHVVHVLQSLHPVEPGLVWEVIDENTRREQVRVSLEERLGGSAASLGIEVHTPLGDPGRQVAAIAQAHEADLIVMPSHGRRGFERLLLGSVTERVLRLAPCPVLVLRVEPDPD